MGVGNNMHFTKAQVDRIFPFHFELSSDLKFAYLGPSIRKILGDIIGARFLDTFVLLRPYIKELNWDKILASSSELFIIQHQNREIVLRGQFEFLEERNSIIFLGSQWVNSVDKLKENKLHIGDFAVHDPTFDLLHILKNVEINNDEIKTLLNKLREKSEIIKRSEAQYKITLNMASEVIYRTNELGYFTYVNLASEKLTGFSSEELLSKRFIELIRPDYRKKALAKYASQIKGNRESTYFEFPIVNRFGEEKWLAQSVQLYHNADSIEFIALAIDITQQKINEQALLESNRKLKLFQTLIDNTKDGIQVALEDGQMVYVNLEASRRLGIPIDEVSKYYVTDFEKTIPDSKAWFKHLRTVRLKGPLIIEGENVNLVTGAKLPVEVTVGFFEINNVGYVIANSRDITQRKLIEESYRKQKEKYQRITANMNLGLMEVDLADRIQYVNPCFEQMCGYSTDELLGQKANKLFLPEKTRVLMDNKIQERIDGRSDMYEILVRNKFGEERWWMISGAPNYNELGELIGSIGIHLDITESKFLELNLEIAKEKAEESSRAKEAFLANMSHEIRTPLNAIIGMIRELNKEKLSDKQAYFVNNTSVASQHLLSVLNNILDISKIEAGELQIDASDFDLKDILNEVKSIMIARCLEKNLYFQINQLNKADTVFIGDASRLRQVLINLVGNAIKFTEEGGVLIEYSIHDLNNGNKKLMLTVKDTGVGMDHSYLEKIFNKFSQEDGSVSRTYGGSGLGMAITKELTQLMNGSIEVQSKKNVGTSMILTFELPAGILSSDAIDSVVLNSDVKVKVLLVEDNEFNRIVARNTLENFNCEVFQCNNGLQAVNILKTGEEFDVILMDLQMPIMDGFESTIIIRNELKINTPIIALSANAIKSVLEYCKKIGMNDCVTKPFEEIVLMESIYKLIDADQTVLQKQAAEKNSDQEPLFKLDRLNNLFRGDQAQINRMISIFIEQTEEACQQIGEANLMGNLLLIYQIVHRIKPSIDSMGIVSLKEPIRLIEKLTKENQSSNHLQDLLTQLLSTLELVLSHLKRLPKN